MASVEIKDVRKSFAGCEVLHGIDIDIADGAFVVLVGASGCGKSTLLRLIAGLDTITSGVILMDGRPVSDAPPKQRDVAMVFQNYALYPHMNVFDNMAFGLRLRGTARSVVAQRVGDAADVLSIGGLLPRYPRQLSGGERQRVAIGRAIVRQPRVFLFDEPLSNLDAKLRLQMRAEIKALHQTLRTTMIYVTHDQVEALTLADRIVVLRAGKVDQIGPPLEIYDRPASIHVAGFIGSPPMNLLGGIVRRDATSAWVETEQGVRLPLRGPDYAEEGREAVYGIRPEHLSLAASAVGIAARVEVVEPMGMETLVLSSLGGVPVRVLLRARLDIQPGEHLSLCPDLGQVHLFDARDGGRLEPLSRW
jgi:multiple sugar transport system ATP-binding protein